MPVELKSMRSISTTQLDKAEIQDMQSTTRLDVHDVDFRGEKLKPCGGFAGQMVSGIRTYVLSSVKSLSSRAIDIVKYLLIAAAFLLYLLFATLTWIHSDCEEVGWRSGYGFLLILYGLAGFIILNRFISRRIIPLMTSGFSSHSVTTIQKTIWFGYLVVLVTSACYLVGLTSWEATTEPRRYLSIGGYVTILVLAFLFSKHPDYVRWDIIGRGVGLHLLVSLILVKMPGGRLALSVFSDKIITFLEYSYAGARFIYGDTLIDWGIFMFKSLSVLFFLASIINVLFYLGILQALFHSLGRVMQLLVGTTIIESSNSVASVFLGMSESPLLFQPYLPSLTTSEIHAIMCSGFATVAGTVLAAYVALGAETSTLVCASILASPASLVLAKLLHPETRPTKTSANNIIAVESTDLNWVDAACKGAMTGFQITVAIGANVLSSVATVACLNGLINWMGRLVGYPDLTFQGIVGLAFIPLAWVMGVTPSQVPYVAEVIGIKTVVNEFVGYKRLGELKLEGKLSARSEAIATYAMCGFANPGSVAILVSTLVVLCPEKRDVVTSQAWRAFVAGSMSSFLSACLAGFLTPEDGFTNGSSDSSLSYLDETKCYFDLKSGG